jgi:DNA-binding LacI/PurR family transcriptional regulator
MENEKFTGKSGRATLKTVADHLGLTAGTISAVLNNTRAADRIPQGTRDRIVAAARELNYQPNPLARALRTGTAFAPRAVAREINSTRGAVVILGAHQFDRAIIAIQQAGLRVHDDFSVLDLNDVPAAWDYPAFESAPENPAYDSAAKPS